jgi:diguanylate cyclase (GGDEF)-like protein/PAS domain S-box-containing protein
VEARTEALIRAHQRLLLYGKILENTSEGMVITDLAGTIIEVNDAMCRQTGYAREQLIGQNPRILKSSRHGPEFYQHLWAELLGTGYWSGEIWDRKPDGGIYPKWLTINAIPTQEGTVSHYVGLSIDISAIKSAEERLHRMAYYDQLTGLPNRALFNDRLRRTVLRIQRRQLQAALLFLDLDRFKNINDTLGHTVGDALLVQVAERIRCRLRESDTVCRMGGDEFTVILSEITRLEDAGQVAGDLIEALSKRFDIEGSEIYVGASVGIALCPRDGLDEETLIKKADAAMYAAKEAGRCTFRFASGELDATSRKRMEIEARLHGAVERGEMVLHYQPLARTAEAAPGRPVGIVGAEALVRWVPEPGVVIGPGTFIQIAEDAGLIGELGEWVIREACRQARGWLDAGLALSVSVNVSARQFENDRLTGVVREALAMAGLPPSLLRLEITESTFMRNMDRVIGIMDGLRALGVLFSIDDFGTGFSSLQYIKCLPAQCLKIDKAFVSGVAASLSDGEVVSAIIALARAFGLKSTAEGVETEVQLRELRDRGCDEVQGYLVAKPMPAPEFLRFALQGTPACEPGP